MWQSVIGADMQGLRWQRAVGRARARAWLELRLGSGLGSSRSGHWMPIQRQEKEGGAHRRSSSERGGSRWPEKSTLDAGGPGARGKLREARRSAVNTVEARALAGEIPRRRRGAAAVARTPAKRGYSRCG